MRARRSGHGVSTGGDGYYLHRDEATFEDGTIDYLSLPAVLTGIEHIRDVDIERIHERVVALTEWLLVSLVGLRHGNGHPLVQVHGPTDTIGRGGTVTFTMHDPMGRAIDDRRVEELANRVNISLRTGCFRKPGAGDRPSAHRRPYARLV